MCLTYPISYPISKLLDKLLGGHSLTRFSAPELKAIIEMHKAKQIEQDIDMGKLTSDDSVKIFNPL